MKLLKSYSGAVMVTVLVIALAIPFGAARSLHQVREKVVAVYENGARGDGHSVRADLDAVRASAANLCTVAERYSPGAPELTALRKVSGTAVNGYREYQDLLAAADALMGALAGQDLDQKDAKYVRGFQTEIQSRQFAIEQDPYNDLAEQFNDRTLRAFPVVLLRPILFVRDLEVYR